MAPASSVPSSSTAKPKRHKWSREDLLKYKQQILDCISNPLPPNLPPSPPASRSASPAPPAKRKLEPSIDRDHSKRARTTALADQGSHQHQAHLPPPPVSTPHAHTHHHQHHSTLHRDSQPNRASLARSEPCEDGEVREDLQSPSSSHTLQQPLATSAITSTMPIRRPRKPKSTATALNALHDKYHNDGRILKYSGDARFWSTYPVTNKEYRPLPDPPPPTSPYHIHGGLIARLELLDALICFTYAIWCRDQSRGACIQETWKTTGPFLDWCKQKWTAEEGDDHEKAFIGLIWMIEGFIQARLEAYSCNSIAASLDELQHSAKSQALSAAEKAEQSGPTASGSRTQGTPPMLPSPASLGAPGSANSTPTSRDAATSGATSCARPAAATNSRPPQSDSELPIPRYLLPPQYKDIAVPSHVLDAVSAVTVPVKTSFLHHVRQQHTKTASKCLTESQNFLTLPIMARCFPLTFNRMVYTTLSAIEEHVPDMEDEAGELFWPGQSITGEGLGWVCLMGKAMINEFGKKYSYQGVKGAVKKPQIDSGIDSHRLGHASHPLPRRPVDANRG